MFVIDTKLVFAYARQLEQKQIEYTMSDKITFGRLGER